MQLLRRVAVLLAAIALCAPVAAFAQTSTIPQGGSGVSTQPPVQLGGDTPPPAAAPAQHPYRAATHATTLAATALPNTGTDPRLLFLVGLAVTLLGVGLRLRTADADLY